MKIILAKNLGYCLGVRRAMELAFTAVNQRRGTVYCHGPLIHNQPAMELLASKGLKLYDPQNPPSDLKEARLIIRAHGLPPLEEAKVRTLFPVIIDATCPKVVAVQRLIAKKAAEGKSILIWGTAGHPEVEGLLGYALGRGVVFGNLQELERLPEYQDIFLVSQTTQDSEIFPEIEAAVLKRYPKAHTEIHKTICEATRLRQEGVKTLCEKANALVIVGGKNSGNTRRLEDLGKKLKIPTVAVEGPLEIPPGFVKERTRIAVASGASTPLWQIRRVYQALSAVGRVSDHNILAFIMRFFRALVLSNIYIALGAGAMGWAMALVVGITLPTIFFGLFFAFTNAMHLLNGFLDQGSDKYNDPDRAEFLKKYYIPLVVLKIFTWLLSLFAANLAGPKVLIFLAILSILGMCYASPLPWGRLNNLGMARFKDVPLAKTLSISWGWSALLIFPYFLASPPFLPLTFKGLSQGVLAFGLIFIQVLARTFLKDLEEARGDRIFGLRSPADILGIRCSVKFLSALYLFWILYLSCGVIINILQPWALLLVISGPLYNALMLRRYLKKPGLGGFQFDIILDGQFLLAFLLLFLTRALC